MGSEEDSGDRRNFSNALFYFSAKLFSTLSKTPKQKKKKKTMQPIGQDHALCMGVYFYTKIFVVAHF